jgi:hypothetical protein
LLFVERSLGACYTLYNVSTDVGVGFVRSRRDGKMVKYSLTEAGVSLLSAVLGDKAAGVSA